MGRLDFYVAQTIMKTMLLAIVGLLGILMIFTFLEQIEDVSDSYRVIDLLLFVLFSAPRMFYETVPYAALIGCLAGLGTLANNSELIVMRAAGVSIWSITLSAMKPTLVLILVSLYVGEYLLPGIERIAVSNRDKAVSGDREAVPSSGLWYREGGVFMHFDEVGQSGVIGGVAHYHFDAEQRLTSILRADRGVYHDVRPGEKYWLLETVVTTRFSDDKTVIETAPSYQWNTGLTPSLLINEVLVRPDKMSIRELSAKVDYMRNQELNGMKFELGFWHKVLQPLATLSLVFVAISFIFGPLRESTMGMRVVTGLVTGIVFKFIQDLLSPASLVFGFPPFIAVVIPIIICFSAGYFLLRRAA
ncbi:LPS export ABC transporter permease LptG [Pseudomonadales bacterium]|nr:LPS export ABC transporter permease LptG [Pseudomonadales bacterium]MDB4150210.1 LPS export ABC transporter permease LptG [Pseudomonadales bacterium]MDB9866124.1 LPS export ABC transporter permease LptG [Pseudomonadales bacterium]MDB9917937.1 LPS export ABC transporter permease LptG [Pseudomonadales bacterium]MDB9942114.1 LPS export ABC transporter permease LptG [Pseudomonadales bacterium]|tara:strand:- start:50 stop:1129 length:1080 start_codon:yes stop_codon:yes gene_type:complete